MELSDKQDNQSNNITNISVSNNSSIINSKLTDYEREQLNQSFNAKNLLAPLLISVCNG